MIHLRNCSATARRLPLTGTIALLLATWPVLAQTPTPAAAPAGTVLPEMVVQGDNTQRGFTNTEATTATRGIAAPVLDTSRSVQTVNRDLIETRQVNDLQETVQTIPGVVRAGLFTGVGETFLLRGFQQEYLIKDGFRAGEIAGNDFSSLGPTDRANIDRVEFFKGPASVLFGRGEPGGVVNYITRLPDFSRAHFGLEQQFGSYEFYRTEGSANVVLVPDKLAARVDAAYDRGESFIDFVQGERYFVAPSVLWKIGPQTTLSFRGEYSHDFRANDPGLPYDTVNRRVVSSAPFSRYLGEPGFTNFTTESLRGLLQLEHRWTDDIVTTLSVHARHAHQEGLYFLLFNFNGPLIDPTGTVGRAAASTDFSDDDLTVRLDQVFNWTIYQAPARAADAKATVPREGKDFQSTKAVITPAEPFAIKNQLLLSAEWDWTRKDDVRDLSSYVGIDPAHPVYSRTLQRTPLFPGAPALLTEITPQDVDTYSLLLQDRLSFGETVYLNFGGRLEFLDGDRATSYSAGSPFGGSSLNGGSTTLNPNAGIVVKPARNVSLYASYAENTDTFKSFNATTSTGGLLEPETSRMYEMGVKAEFFNQRLIATASLFQIEKRNVIGTDPGNPLFSINAGSERSQGVELELAGEILPGWKVTAGYAYTDAQVTNDPLGLNTGHRRYGVPEHAGGLFTTYEIQEGPLKGLGFGGGVTLADRVEVDNANTGDLSGYATGDLVLYYRRDRVRFQVNAKNITDNEFYFAENQASAVQRGQGRTIVGSIKYDF